MKKACQPRFFMIGCESTFNVAVLGCQDFSARLPSLGASIVFSACRVDCYFAGFDELVELSKSSCRCLQIYVPRKWQETIVRGMHVYRTSDISLTQNEQPRELQDWFKHESMNQCHDFKLQTLAVTVGLRHFKHLANSLRVSCPYV